MWVRNLYSKQNQEVDIYLQVLCLHKQITSLSTILEQFESKSSNLSAQTITKQLAELLIAILSLGKYWNLDFSAAYTQMIKESEIFIEKNKTYVRI